jgi:hypothetical protein
MKRGAKIILIIIAAFLIISVGIGVAVRQSILNNIIEQIISSQKKTKNLNISIAEAKFEGLSAVRFSKIVVVPQDRDTLLSIDSFRVEIHIIPLLFGTIKVQELSSSNGTLFISNKDSVRNFDFLFRKEKVDSTKVSRKKIDLANLADNLLNDLLYKIPDENLRITNYTLKVIDDDKHFTIKAEYIGIEDEKLYSTFILNNGEAVWHADGTIQPSDKKLNIRFYAENKKVELPYLEQKLGLKMNFDTIATRMDKITYSGDELKIFGSWSVSNLLINHEKIAADDVQVHKASIDCNMFFGENYVSVDSSSIAYLEKLSIHPFIKYTIGADKIYELKINTDKTTAQDFFDSFPQGLFKSLEGIKVEGNLSYHLNFYLDSKDPWHCKFDSRLAKENFSIIKFGNTNFQKINSDFVYVPYEYGRPMRSIYVGPMNPNYTPYEDISDYVKNAILTAEDPSFFSHRGFYEEAFRQSIATNFVTKKFKRGGSTISMQLVKNVYLNRGKTIARKLEEILIVWLIENNRLTGKQRMFEVYLNIIEWAPNIYGIGEASRFYFNKRPADLSVGESIFLASIVPKPKKFKYSFTKDGTLKPYMRGYMRLIGGLMIRRSKIAETDTVQMFESVELKGPAKNYVVATDTLRTPTIMEEIEEEVGGFFKNLFESIKGKKKKEERGKRKD